MENIKKSFKNKKILVTGHTGFKGSWLSLWLKELGADVSGYSLPPKNNPNLYSILNLDLPETLADINDKNSLSRHLKKYKPEIIFHLAAQPLVRESYIDPVGTFQTNIAGVWNLLDLIKKSPSVKVVVIVTTDKCYKNNEKGVPFVESDPLGGYDPYSASKACVEIICESWKSSFFSEKDYPVLATVRAGNVIGGGDWAIDRLIPDCVRSFISNEPVNIRYPNSIRPWQHVLEALSGYIILAEKLYNFGNKYSGAWNFGPNIENQATVGDVVSIASELWGTKNVFKKQSINNLHEVELLRLDITKATQELDWRPRWDINQTLSETVEWYKKWHQGNDMLIYTINQIKKYGM